MLDLSNSRFSNSTLHNPVFMSNESTTPTNINTGYFFVLNFRGRGVTNGSRFQECSWKFSCMDEQALCKESKSIGKEKSEAKEERMPVTRTTMEKKIITHYFITLLFFILLMSPSFTKM